MTRFEERQQWGATALKQLEAGGVTITKLAHGVRLVSPFGHLVVSDPADLGANDVDGLTHPAPVAPEDRSSATDARTAMRSFSNRR